MRIMKRAFPVVCIMAITLIMSLLLYGELLEREESKCWKELSNTTQFVNREIITKFQDEIAKLHLVATIMIQDDIFGVDDIGNLHLDTLQTTTIFSRIDVLYPDNTIISDGTKSVVEENISFDDIAAKGECITSRIIDFETGNECVYYVLPVIKNGEIFAVLVGVIEANSLSEIFHPIIYDGQANICIIDSKDGNYIMDSWHDELGNAYEMEEREKLEGYEEVDWKKSLRNLETGAFAFVSHTTGKPIYMYYTPVGMFEWQLLIFAQEDVIFGNLLSLRKVFILAGIAEAVLLILYFWWNISTVRRLEKSYAEIEKQKEQLKCISYRDTLTSMYNRNKYTEVWESLKEKNLKKVGVAYIDLNGLKQINDSQFHEAGDNYIRNAADVISEIFTENGYRIGGDEFVILVIDMDQDEFKDKIATLKESMQREQISVSTGFLWEERCSNLNELLKEAERQMYEDKENYYLTHDRRRQ